MNAGLWQRPRLFGGERGASMSLVFLAVALPLLTTSPYPAIAPALAQLINIWLTRRDEYWRMAFRSRLFQADRYTPLASADTHPHWQRPNGLGRGLTL